MSTKENRRASRVSHNSVLEIYDAGGHFITGIGRMVNFSKVGVCFSSTKIFKIGDHLQARLRLLREGTLDVSAQIVWSKQKPNTNLYGLAFEDVRKIRQ